MNDSQAMASSQGRAAPPITLVLRLMMGAAQGAALYVVFSLWNMREPQFGFSEIDWAHFVSVARTVFFFGPLPFLFGIGNLPPVRLAVWSIAAPLLLILFGWLGVAPVWNQAPPLITVWLFSLIVIFIIHEFVQAAADDDRYIARFATYFDRAWSHGIQALLALIFVGAFWAVISIGALLFGVIGLESVREFIFSDEFAWFSIAVTFALAVHVTDAGAALTRGVRSLGLTMLSLLAVLMTAILTAFLIALLFTGLQPLWDTGFATVLLLNATATMILLVNAAFQDGRRPNSAIMRYTVRFSAIPMLGVISLAFIGLWLRVNQYGFTPPRVLASVEWLIVAFHCVGYGYAATRPGEWMAFIKRVNVAGAILVAILLSLLMTPVLDPARISVDNQIVRLDSGRVDPDDFDFGFLASDRSRHWGKLALEKLTARSGSERDERIALLANNPGDQSGYLRTEQTFNDRSAAVYLVGEGKIPDAALLPMQAADPIARCLSEYREFENWLAGKDRNRTANSGNERVRESARHGRCQARMIDLDFDGDDDLLLHVGDWVSERMDAGAYWAILQEAPQRWRVAGKADYESMRESAVYYNDVKRSTESLFTMESIEGASVKAAPINDLSVGKGMLRFIPDRTALDSRERIKVLEGENLPDIYWAFNPAPGLAERCYTNCYGRFVDVIDGGAEEFVVFEIGEFWLRPQARAVIDAYMYQRIDGKWAYYGKARDIVADEALGEKGRDSVMETLSVAPAKLGDLQIGPARDVFVPKSE